MTTEEIQQPTVGPKKTEKGKDLSRHLRSIGGRLGEGETN